MDRLEGPASERLEVFAAHAEENAEFWSDPWDAMLTLAVIGGAIWLCYEAVLD